MREIAWNIMGYISVLMAVYKHDIGFYAIGLSCFVLAKLHEEKP